MREQVRTIRASERTSEKSQRKSERTSQRKSERTSQRKSERTSQRKSEREQSKQVREQVREILCTLSDSHNSSLTAANTGSVVVAVSSVVGHRGQSLAL